MLRAGQVARKCCPYYWALNEFSISAISNLMAKSVQSTLACLVFVSLHCPGPYSNLLMNYKGISGFVSGSNCDAATVEELNTKI